MLAWAVIEEKVHKLPPSHPDVWEDLRREIALERPLKVILSAEAFSRANDGEVGVVGERLKDFDVLVVIYVRDPCSYLESTYKQCVKQGKCAETFGRFVRKNADLCDYVCTIRRWRRVFGRGTVIVRRYEEAGKNGLISDFAGVVNIDGSLLEERVTANVSPPNEVIHAIRYLNLLERLFSGSSFGASGRRSKLIHKARRKLLRNSKRAQAALSVGGLLQKKTMYSAEDKAWLQQRMAALEAYASKVQERA